MNQNFTQLKKAEVKMSAQLVKIDELIETVDKLPKENFYYEGIKENSLSLLVAPAKVGKTTMAENLAMCIASGQEKYLDKPVWSGTNKKVMIISLEEFFRGRTERNKKQVAYVDGIVGNSEWHENLFVSPTDGQRYIETKKDWEILLNSIQEINPAFTVIDSLSRMHGSEAIEDSSTCIELMRNLRNIVDKSGTTMMVVHHTNKLSNDPVSQFNMAGSRILSQEADAIIGMNKTPAGKRYIKPLAYRYADDSSDTVQLFTRNEHQWLISDGNVKEYKLLKELDKRTDNKSAEIVMDYFLDHTAGDYSVLVETKELVKTLVDTKTISKPTLHKALDCLLEEGTIVKQDKGLYSLVLPPE